MMGLLADATFPESDGEISEPLALPPGHGARHPHPTRRVRFGNLAFLRSGHL